MPNPLKPPRQYSVILCDPPWAYTNRGVRGAAAKHYATLSPAQIQALPVSNWAAPDAVLVLWCTNPMLPEGLKTIEKWGFNYVTKLPWIKFVGNPQLDKDGNIVEGDLAWGTGWWARGVSEDILLARRGVVKPPEQATAGLLGLVAKRDKHSNKPVIVQELIEHAWPGPYLELFARQLRPGWDVWGDEVASTIDLLQGLPGDYLQDVQLHAALAEIKRLWDTSETAHFAIGDILGELCKTLVPPYTKTDLWRLAAAQMTRVGSHHYPMLMQHISQTYKKDERSREKSWNAYRKQYDLIRAVKEVTRQRERERHRAIGEFIDTKFGFVDRSGEPSAGDAADAPHAQPGERPASGL